MVGRLKMVGISQFHSHLIGREKRTDNAITTTIVMRA